MKDSNCKYTKVSNDDIESKYTAIGVDSGVDNSYLLEDEKVRHEVKVLVPTTKNKKESCCKKKKLHCCLKRCLKICLCIILALLGLALGVGIFTYMKIAAVVDKWTTHHPYEGNIPITDVPPGTLDVLFDEGKLFVDRILADQQPDDFVLTATDINGLAASSDYLRGNMYVDIHPNEVTAIESLPMEFLPGGRGRFLVGKSTMVWDAEESILHATMVSLDNDDEHKMEQPFYDVRLLVGFEEGQGLSSLTLLSGQFLDWVVSQDFIDERMNLLEVLKHSCGHHHRYRHGHGHHDDDHHHGSHFVDKSASDDHYYHHHDKHDDYGRHHHGHHDDNDHHRHGHHHHHHHHHDVKADIVKVLSGIKGFELEEGQLVIRANSPEERNDPAHRMLATEEENSYGKQSALSTAFKLWQNVVRI